MILIRKFGENCFKYHSLPRLYFHSSAKAQTHKTHKTQIRQRKPQTSISNVSPAQLHVIGSVAAGQPAAVVLRVFDKSYLFNCGEGIKLYCEDSKINLKKISNVFFTQSKWNCIGGIINLVCTTFEHTHRPPKFHGPNNLQTIFQRMIHLSSHGQTFRKYFLSDSFTSNQLFEDDRVVIVPVELRSESETTVIYLCKILQRRGTYSLKKAKDSRIPFKLLPILLRGKDVTLDDGTIIASDDLRQPDLREIVFILIDVPNDGFFKDLESNKKLKNLLNEDKLGEVEVIVHFTPQNVFNTEKYQHFVRKIGAKNQLIVNDRNKYATMEEAFQLQSKLNKIESKIHPMLSMRLDPDPKIYHLNDGIDAVALVDRALNFKREGSESKLIQPIPLKLQDEQFPRILFLGTSAAGSFPLRNSSGILVHLSYSWCRVRGGGVNFEIFQEFDGGNFEFVCGTSICSQINRFYGDEAPEIYRRLKAVFVSHMHLDHHIGLPELFRWRQIHLPLVREPLRVFCPLNDLKSWLLFYAKHVDPIHSDIKLFDNDILMKDNLNYKERLYLNIDSLVTCPVEHYRKSYALSMTIPYQNGDKCELFKVAYSGDTGASDAFVKIGRNADLLIHEATYQSEMTELAQKYKHSTVAMALEQAQQMHAKHTILTHFSARYPILPYIRPNELTDNVSIAFDYMEIQPKDLPRLSALVNQYHKAFPAAQKPLEQQTKKYLIKNQLLVDLMAFA